MAFYLIGLGLGERSLSVEAKEVIEKSERVYLEGYTVNFPYDLNRLGEVIGREFEVLGRERVEGEGIIDEALAGDVCLLVYGGPLMATTHMQLISSCIERGVEYRIFHNASIFDAVSETGLEIYRFGKTASLPDWKEHKNKPTSFARYVKENLSINAHTLLLVDIGLDFDEALGEVREAFDKEGIEMPNKIVVISRAGTEEQETYFLDVEKDVDLKIKKPFSIIFPAELNDFEKRFLSAVSRQI